MGASNPIETILRSFLDQPDVVVFVGSGLSSWSGLPTWDTLLSKLIEVAAKKGSSTQLAQEALANKQLLDAADALPLTPVEIANALRDALGFAAAKPHEVHSLLLRLGPRRFVTTNYDNLIEQQLGLTGALGTYRVVMSRQVAELADIVKASADNFVFKPHGDIADADSIVLSTRDYDRLIAGDTNAVRQVLEILMVTRPILFLGYGLRDPDTRLILRTLHDRYLGNIGHFMAVFADASEDHKNYFWDHYRIRIQTYPTKPNAYGRDHSALVNLLRTLVTAKPDPAQTHVLPKKRTAVRMRNARGVNSSSSVEGLIRYAARLVRPEPPLRFDIFVSLEYSFRHYDLEKLTKFRHANLEEVLQFCPGSFVICGPAGSGKSFGISSFLSRIGQQLIDWGSRAKREAPAPIFPILLDARLYNGSFQALAADTLPAELDLKVLSRTHDVVVYLDSLDEMPLEYLDGSKWRADLEVFVASVAKVRLIYGTRRAELVGRSDIPIFYVDALEGAVAKQTLGDIGLDFESLPHEFQSALHTPFLLLLTRRYLPSRGDIRSAPQLLAVFLEEAIDPILGPIEGSKLRDTLCQLAAESIESGRETIRIEDAERYLNPANKLSVDVVDALVATGVMVSETGSHVRFVHRTVTEFLAAQKIIQGWQSGLLNFFDLLSSRRWDNPVIWAVEALPEQEAPNFTLAVFKVDPVVAARIVAAAEIESVRIWSTFLAALESSVPKAIDWQRLDDCLGSVRVPEEIVPQLKRMLASSSSRAFVVRLYAEYATEQELRMWLDTLGSPESLDLSSALGERLPSSLIGDFVRKLERTKFEARKEEGSPTEKESIFENVLSSLHEDNLRAVVRQLSADNQRVCAVVCHATYSRDLREINQFIIRQVDYHNREAIWPLYMRLRFHDKNAQCLKDFRPTEARTQFLVAAMLKQRRAGLNWSLSLFEYLRNRDQEWSRVFNRVAKVHRSKVVRQVLRVTASNPSSRVVSHFVKHAFRNPAALAPLEWAVMEELGEKGIRLDEKLVLNSFQKYGEKALALLDQFGWGDVKQILKLSNSMIDSWIDVLRVIFEKKTTEIVARLNGARYFAEELSRCGRTRTLARANDAVDPGRDFLLSEIVWRMPGVSSDDLTPESAERMLRLYIKHDRIPFESPGDIATERFVNNSVLPFAKSIAGNASNRRKIEEILSSAGRRHDRRYWAPWNAAPTT
jgi:hypothetical protein